MPEPLRKNPVVCRKQSNEFKMLFGQENKITLGKLNKRQEKMLREPATRCRGAQT
jgi:hypothetical protein